MDIILKQKDKQQYNKVLDKINDVLGSKKHKGINKFYAMLLLKDCVTPQDQKSNTDFVVSLLKHSVLKKIQEICEFDKGNKKETRGQTMYKENEYTGIQIIRLCMECIMKWAKTWENDKNGKKLQFIQIQENLKKQNIQFPDSYLFFEEKKAAAPVQESKQIATDLMLKAQNQMIGILEFVDQCETEEQALDFLYEALDANLPDIQNIQNQIQNIDLDELDKLDDQQQIFAISEYYNNYLDYHLMLKKQQIDYEKFRKLTLEEAKIAFPMFVPQNFQETKKMPDDLGNNLDQFESQGAQVDTFQNQEYEREQEIKIKEEYERSKSDISVFDFPMKNMQINQKEHRVGTISEKILDINTQRYVIKCNLYLGNKSGFTVENFKLKFEGDQRTVELDIQKIEYMLKFIVYPNYRALIKIIPFSGYVATAKTLIDHFVFIFGQD
ncbi:hypothetical protein IMG5_201680 [Ichthyophthirius multifiliis]|uniref:Uncharacterized protein n=1 Tax=Ichthyophthirius multifiliis TaxID=5932 RepID=G0R5W6_ICHMU|nr:hypothetical protein IMG5_201680 [Ichthyophthirius multifiliis]EGR27143.1 hypothetical protein IMG5_201680 [Ichthyophthirius multifiliis]|eukprot:XP_004024027.1 hypothetical protein IMG5_201680 [Ichthyophthirius multifiliis]